MKCALTLKSHESAVTCLQFDQTKLVSGSLDGTLKLWDLKNGTSLLDTIKVPTRSKKTVGVTAMKLRDNLILTGGFDKVAQLWDIRLKESERCIRTFDGHMDELSVVAFSGAVFRLSLCV
jgi:WD40 repeat protein